MARGGMRLDALTATIASQRASAHRHGRKSKAAQACVPPRPAAVAARVRQCVLRSCAAEKAARLNHLDPFAYSGAPIRAKPSHQPDEDHKDVPLGSCNYLAYLA